MSVVAVGARIRSRRQRWMNPLQRVGFWSAALRWRIVLPIIAVLWGVYLGELHPWLMSWGATAAEVQMALPGDDPALGQDAYFTPRDHC